jgi:prenylcysteine oxidase/farnesylcysteine lyase
MTTSFVKLYTRSTPRWTSIEELSTAFGWNTLTTTTTADYFVKEKGVSKMFTEEMVQASTRVNYAQDIGEIHALEGAASMASGEASSVKGGNWQVFEQFAKRSGAKVLLNTKVKSISRKERKAEGQTDQANDVNSRRAARWTVETSLGNTESYDAVILAAPYHQTGISIRSPALSDDAAILAKVPLQPYVHLHVTLLSTKAPTPRPSYFGWADDKTDVPTMVLTTPAQNGQQPEFNSLSYHGLLKYRNGTERVDTEKEWVVKIFSMQPISDEWLKDVFRGQVGWVHRKEVSLGC